MTTDDASFAPSPPNPPRFSILLPTHNRPDVLPFAIRSVLWQTVGDFELLIAGDGCTDGTAAVVRGFDDPRIRWFDLPKAPGIGYANRNRALREARGRHIAYLAHDDLWFPDHLERLGARLDEETGNDAPVLVYSRLLALDLDGRLRPSWYNLEIPRHADGLWRGDAAITMSAVAHPRDALARYGEWDETLRHGGDFALWHRLLARAGRSRIRFLSEPTAIHCVANWRRGGAYDARMRIARWGLARWLDERMPPALRPPMDDRVTQQEALWQHLSAAPAARVAEVRQAIGQFQDALLWDARTTAGLFALRGGLAAARLLERAWRQVAWLGAPAIRRRYAHLRAHTRALEAERRRR